MDPDCFLGEGFDICLKLALQLLHALVSLQVEVDNARLVKGIEVAECLVVSQLQIMHNAITWVARASLGAQLRAKFSNQPTCTIMKQTLELPDLLLKACLTIFWHRAWLKKEYLLLQQWKGFVESVSVIVELGYRVTEIIAQMEDSKYDVERSLDDSEGQNDDHNT